MASPVAVTRLTSANNAPPAAAAAAPNPSANLPKLENTRPDFWPLESSLSSWRSATSPPLSKTEPNNSNICMCYTTFAAHSSQVSRNNRLDAGADVFWRQSGSSKISATALADLVELLGKCRSVFARPGCRCDVQLPSRLRLTLFCGLACHFERKRKGHSPH